MNKQIIIFVVLIIAASGCTDNTSNTQKNANSIVVNDFSIADSTLRPNQQSVVEATITNHNTAPTNLRSENITLYSLGALEKSSKSCNPDSIGSARKDLSPSMRCSWTIRAPGEEYIQGFESKPTSFKLGIRYNTTLENKKSIEIMFDEVNNIDQSGKFSRSFSNGDLSISVEGDRPITVGDQRNLDLKIQNTGPGDIIGNITIKCSTQSDLEYTNCPTEEELIRGESRTSVGLLAESRGTRNLFISTSYKYRKSPNLDIEVVNN